MRVSDTSQITHSAIEPLLKNLRSNSLSSSRPISLSSCESGNFPREKTVTPLIDRDRVSVLPTIFDNPPLLSEKGDESQLLSDSSKTIFETSQDFPPKKPTGSLSSSQRYSQTSIPFDELEFSPTSQQVKQVLGGTKYHIASEFIRLNSLLARSPNSNQVTGSYNSIKTNHFSLSVPDAKELSRFGSKGSKGSFGSQRQKIQTQVQFYYNPISQQHPPTSILSRDSQYSLAIPPNAIYSPQPRTFDFLNTTQFNNKVPTSTLPPKHSLFSDIPTGGRLFVGGILFFPLWFVGSFLKIHVSETSIIRDKSERIQREWRNWNRAMAVTCSFFIIIMVILGVAGVITYSKSHNTS